MRELAIGKSATKHKGLVALVDDEDYERVARFNWYMTARNGKDVLHVIRCANVGQFERRLNVVPLARQILNAPKDTFILHRNGSYLDCTKNNLVALTRQEYLATLPPRKGSKSKYKGVGYLPKTGRWKATIHRNHEKRHLGTYSTEAEAAKAYDKAVFEKFGELAYLNFTR